MPSLFSGQLIKEVRVRKKLRQTQLISDHKFDDRLVSRLENAHQSPYDDTFKEFMNELQMPVTTYFCPYLENQPMDVFVTRDKVLNLLDSDMEEAWKKAGELLKEMEDRGGFDDGINRQFILSCTARLNELLELNPAQSVELIKEGIALTYENFDEKNFEGDMLIFEEPTLLHTLAAAYWRMGKSNEAIALLFCVQKGISRLPEDDHEKEKKLAPVLLTLSNFLIHNEDYNEALALCRSGNAASLKRNNGKYTPEFVYNEAICHYYLGNIDECKKLFRQSYFGYSLLRKKDKAELVRKFAEDAFGIQFNTYGVEDLEYEDFDPVIGHGESIACKSIGDLISILRIHAKMTQKELCYGICSQSNFNKIETGKIAGNVYYLEAFMQRLGRDINKYFSTFPNIEDFQAKQIRNEVNSQILALDFESAAEHLERLKTRKSFQKSFGLQFVKNAEATVFGGMNGYDKPKYLELLEEALALTVNNFDEEMVHKYRLTNNEITIISQIAIHYCESGNMARGIKLYERLRDSMNRYYVDEKEKVRMYSVILYNYSKYLGLMERYKEALEIINEGENIVLRHCRLTLLPGFANNKACGFLELGEKQKSVPYFAMAYYGSALVRYFEDEQAIADYVKERLEIIFD